MACNDWSGIRYLLYKLMGERKEGRKVKKKKKKKGKRNKKKKKTGFTRCGLLLAGLDWGVFFFLWRCLCGSVVGGYNDSTVTIAVLCCIGTGN